MAQHERRPLAASRLLLHALHGTDTPSAPRGILPTVLGEIGLADRYFPFESILGTLLIAFGSEGIAAVGRGQDEAAFVEGYTRRHGRPLYPIAVAPTNLERAIARQLAGERADLRFDLRGLSDFERATLLKALDIPAGEIRPYGWIAREIGRPGAVRAVGSALGRNPIPLLIPCHRVVRSDGRIGEYIFGGEAKRAVLTAEGLSPEAIEAEARAGIRYHASDTTGIYCFPTCRHARRITTPHRVTFASDTAAQAAGYRPCKVCRPALAS
jgi:O-6-methylguanine DNA methyltransferase